MRRWPQIQHSTGFPHSWSVMFALVNYRWQEAKSLLLPKTLYSLLTFWKNSQHCLFRICMSYFLISLTVLSQERNTQSNKERSMFSLLIQHSKDNDIRNTYEANPARPALQNKGRGEQRWMQACCAFFLPIAAFIKAPAAILQVWYHGPLRAMRLQF